MHDKDLGATRYRYLPIKHSCMSHDLNPAGITQLPLLTSQQA